jgi:hypothetical protein
MAALYLHNSIWVPDAAETPRGLSPHARTTSSATIQTLSISDLSHPTQPLLHSSTSESVAYLDLLSRQPNHPNAPRGSPMGLSFDGDPTTMRERKGYLEKTVRRRLRRLKAMIAVLEVIIGAFFLPAVSDGPNAEFMSIQCAGRFTPQSGIFSGLRSTRQVPTAR